MHCWTSLDWLKMTPDWALTTVVCRARPVRGAPAATVLFFSIAPRASSAEAATAPLNREKFTGMTSTTGNLQAT